MPQEQTLILGLAGQVLAYDVPEGRPSSVTCALYDPSLREDDTQNPVNNPGGAALSATASTINTTLATLAAGAAATNPRMVTLASLTGVEVGSVALITNAAGQKEEVRVASFGSSSGQIILERALVYDYAITTSTFVGLRVNYALAASLFASTGWLGDEAHIARSYGVRWAYTVASVDYVRWTYAHLVRRAPTPTAARELAAHLPHLRDMEPTSQQDGGATVMAEAEWMVQTKLEASGIDPATLRGNGARALLVKLQTKVLLGEQGRLEGRSAEDALRHASEEFERFFARCTDGRSGVPVDANQDGALTDDEREADAPGLYR